VQQQPLSAPCTPSFLRASGSPCRVPI
jgi:hypothetical protein